MKRSTLLLPLLTTLVGLLTSGSLSAQFVLPFRSTAGVETAAAEAAVRLGVDARLVLIGAVGELDAAGMPIRFHPDNGESDAWAYVFYSPSKKRHESIPVIEIVGIGRQAVDDPAQVPIPAEMTTMLDLTLPFAGSERMIERLKSDTTYARYHQQLPKVLPQTIAYRTLLADDVLILPSTFPLDAPAWVLTYTGGGDSMMLCYISGSTGETFSLRAEATASVSLPQQGDINISAAGSTTGMLRVSVTQDAQGTIVDEPTVMLFDITGRHVTLPAMVRRNGNGWLVEFDANALPAGAYFVRVAGWGWNRTIGVMR